jgi:hypothetical protein
MVSLCSWTGVALWGLGMLLRVAMMRWPHSGQGVEPLHGDFEAQRHWIEVTANLPPSEWYHNRTDNDMQYWGLDYPPLTAWHARAMAAAASAVRPSISTLFDSRGAEGPGDRLFMRFSVLAVDLAVLLPACLLLVWLVPRRLVGEHLSEKAFWRLLQRHESRYGTISSPTEERANDASGDDSQDREEWVITRESKSLEGSAPDEGASDSVADSFGHSELRAMSAAYRWVLPPPSVFGRWAPLAWVWLCPLMLLVDHGHFQYNSASLGLAIASWGLLGASTLLEETTASSPWLAGLAARMAAAVAFAAALNYKQMELFHAPAAFVAHLVLSWRSARRAGAGLKAVVVEVVCVGMCVMAVTAWIWLAMCPPGALTVLPSGVSAEPQWNVLAEWLVHHLHPQCQETLWRAVQRVFPFNRGLFEDKVASLWCAVEPVFRFRRRLIQGSLHLHSVLQASTIATLLLLAPATLSALVAAGCCSCRMRPLPPNPPLARPEESEERLRPRARREAVGLHWTVWVCLLSSASSLAFFLAAFHVHEKTVLLPLLPIVVASGLSASVPFGGGRAPDVTTDVPVIRPPPPSAAGAAVRRLVAWLQPLCVLSVLPLFLKDGIAPAALAMGAACSIALGEAWVSREVEAVCGNSRASSPEDTPIAWVLWQHRISSLWATLVPPELAELLPFPRPLVESFGFSAWGASSALKVLSVVHLLVAPLSTVAHWAIVLAWGALPPPTSLPDLYPQLLATVHCGTLLWVLIVVTVCAWQSAAECADDDEWDELGHDGG